MLTAIKNKLKNDSSRIALIGGGSYATAIAKILCEQKKCNTNWWMRDKKSVEFIKKQHFNPRYLSAVRIKTSKCKPMNSLKRAISPADIVILAVPSAFLRDALKGLSKKDFEGKIVCSAIKGLIPETHEIIGEYLHNTFDIPLDNIVVITGPCHAEEVAKEKLSYLTIASKSINNANTVASYIGCRYIQTKVSDDIYGTEYSAVLKNIFAIACGISHGLGYGDNYQAVLISNAIQEIERFVAAVHPIKRDIKGSAYLGDLMVTTYSQFSRNRTFGMMIGRGYTPKIAQLEMNMIAEGYYAVKSIHAVNQKYNVQMPIAEAVYRIIYEKSSALEEFSKLSMIIS
jgi:glycerol-3-phosphate dehydrogenase (NAD(P)+)